jgi:hypothetical protein
MPKERFPLNRKAVGYEYAEGAATRLSGAKTQVVDVNVNLLAEAEAKERRKKPKKRAQLPPLSPAFKKAIKDLEEIMRIRKILGLTLK